MKETKRNGYTKRCNSTEFYYFTYVYGSPSSYIKTCNQSLGK